MCVHDSEIKLPCFAFDSDDTYPDRVSILNIYGKLGWEVINEIDEGGGRYYYLLKKPLLQ